LWIVKALRGDGQASGGYDAGKQIKGRKRFLTVDTLGLILRVYVMAASGENVKGQTSSPTSSPDGKRSISAAYHGSMVGLMVNPYAVGDHGLRLDCPSRATRTDQRFANAGWLNGLVG